LKEWNDYLGEVEIRESPMSKIQIVNVKEMANAVVLTMNHIEDAEFIVVKAREAGFDGSRVQPQPSGFSGTNMQQVLIGVTGGGQLDEIRNFLNGMGDYLEPPRTN
jgi:hypothetical protein